MAISRSRFWIARSRITIVGCDVVNAVHVLPWSMVTQMPLSVPR